ncbi:ABC transporter ATP-binding protein [Rhizobium sp. P32RR-XVIII]|uniref:ABC transporter ATP-binding protein n=1 Tax=Rhizobium sp. P32RR-XVIII TaxID=2726738 RepID=UPI00145718E8|nr:ABC transporter ATP-binding protein [Rhizobium sp. P32RR-XVIII]NLS06071.1 ABC transporter ATP-binding protein [Rhizobium sp. P32RR-XVIII]
MSFTVDAGEILVIVGGSGSGKTTTLRCVAGLEEPSSGQVTIDGATVSSSGLFVPPERRGIGMVFQSYALWPHMTIYENVAYGLVLKRTPAAQINEAVMRVMDLVGLGGLEKRFPSTLSGGQQQRVALARSAVVEPKVLLLDEPLSNLDAKLREQMRTDLRVLVRKLNMTAIHITHDQNEAMAIADKVIYMHRGRIEQAGTPRELYRSPNSKRVAQFIGSATFIDGKVVRPPADGKVVVQTPDGTEIVSCTDQKLDVGGLVTIAVRPENVVLSQFPTPGENVFTGTIADETYLGDRIESLIDALGTKLRVWHADDIPVGSEVYCSVKPAKVLCFGPGT